MKVSWEQVLPWRLRQQLLDGPSATAVDAARQIAGVQAQVMSAAELAVFVRTGRPPDHVRETLWQHRSLVKTWAMRGTLHLLAADDLPTWVAALRQKEHRLRRTPAWEKYHGMTVDQLHKITTAVGDVLGARPTTREELAAQVSDATGNSKLGEILKESWGGTVLKSAAANGDLCFGPDRGRNVTFVDARKWLTQPWKEPDPAEAMGIIVNRFLDAYGPATTADFARWWGVPPADGKKLMRALIPDLVEVDLDGTPSYVTAAGADGLAKARRAKGHARLLPAFDAYVLAPHGHRRYTWPERLHGRISRAAGWITPTLLVDGRIVGVWSLERRGGTMVAAIEPFTPLTKLVRAAAEKEARALEPVAGAPVAIEWTMPAA